MALSGLTSFWSLLLLCVLCAFQKESLSIRQGSEEILLHSQPLAIVLSLYMCPFTLWRIWHYPLRTSMWSQIFLKVKADLKRHVVSPPYLFVVAYIALSGQVLRRFSNSSLWNQRLVERGFLHSTLSHCRVYVAFRIIPSPPPQVFKNFYLSDTRC